MKAIVYRKYGSPEELKLEELPIPAPKDHEVLIQIHAVSVNSWDWDLLRGEPVFIRMWGLFKPGYQILGSDIAGKVVEVGSKVSRWKKGDDVFGDLCACGWGGFAEYVCVPEDVLTSKPDNITFEQAASMPQAGVLAYQGLVDYGSIHTGSKVLINGAGGGVGSFGIQIAKSIGAEVTAVDSASKFDMLQELGADHMLDYHEEDYTKTGRKYDLILDNVATRSLSDYKRALNPGGIFVMVGGSTSTILRAMAFRNLVTAFGDKKLAILAHKPNKGLDELINMYNSGMFVPVLDKSYSLPETPEAMRRLGEGKVMGKIVISVQ